MNVRDSTKSRPLALLARLQIGENAARAAHTGDSSARRGQSRNRRTRSERLRPGAAERVDSPCSCRRKRRGMRQELDSAGYAVAANPRGRFHQGLNFFSGETGGGKSLAAASLALLFGTRAGGARRLKLRRPCTARLHRRDRLDSFSPCAYGAGSGDARIAEGKTAAAVNCRMRAAIARRLLAGGPRPEAARRPDLSSRPRRPRDRRAETSRPRRCGASCSGRCGRR